METFDWKVYLDNYSDLRAAGITTERQALKHWKMHGQKENRSYKQLNITNYLNNFGFFTFEGYSQQIPDQLEDLKELSKYAKNILEIGFNAGHSSEIFLKNNPIVNIVSFDLNCHSYVKVAKEYINQQYPNRHELILGDSTVTVPIYLTDIKFDIIFIDGGHDYNIAKADIDNCQKFSHNDTIIILDDTMYTNGWEQDYTLGPTKIWNEYINSKIIELKRKDYQIGRGMSWGKYISNS